MSGYRDVLDDASAACLQLGIRILQGHRLANDDAAHVSALLYRLNPPHGAKILDIGCGFGEVARLMARERADLQFVLLNENAGQLAHAPTRFPRIRADLHDLPLADASVDVAMFLYVLCHSDLGRALTEAARVTRPGGELFIYDYTRRHGSNRLMRKRLYARAPLLHQWVNAMNGAGWQVYDFEAPAGSDAVFRRAYGNDAEYDRIFSDLVPMIWKARKPSGRPPPADRAILRPAKADVDPAARAPLAPGRSRIPRTVAAGWCCPPAVGWTTCAQF